MRSTIWTQNGLNPPGKSCIIGLGPDDEMAGSQERGIAVNTAKTRAALVSVASNTSLVVLKLVIGILSGSVSIISEAIHSANDLLASIIAYFSVRISDRPADTEHPFGHGKAESISGVVEAALIVFAAVWIVVEAVKKIIMITSGKGGEVLHLGWGTAVMVISVIVNTIVARYLFKVARKEDSVALEADAHHLSTDVYTSLGVAGGLLVVWITDWHIIDPIVAILVAALIFSIGWKLTISAGRHLMDSSLPDVEVAEIEKFVKAEPRVVSWHRLRTRKSGSQRHIDFHIVMPAGATLVEAHAIADELEKQIATRFAPANVVIHVDPYDAVKDGKESGNTIDVKKSGS
jgi:cation diffusion facilitator family transporter